MRSAPRNSSPESVFERQGCAPGEMGGNVPGELARGPLFQQHPAAAGWDPYEVWRTRVRATHVACDVVTSLLPDRVDSDGVNLPAETPRVGTRRRMLRISWLFVLLYFSGFFRIEPGIRQSVGRCKRVYRCWLSSREIS
jgi:hypothetical protein